MATLPAAVLSGSMAVFLVDLLRLDGSKNVLLNKLVETRDSWDPWDSWDLGALGALEKPLWDHLLGPLGDIWRTLGGPLGDPWGTP